MLDVRTLFAQAVGHHQAGRLDAAVTGYGQVLALKPDSTAALNNLGNALCEQGRFEEAEGHYRRALALAPGEAEAHNNLGALLFERGRLEEAADCCRRAISLKPEHAEAHHNLGAVFSRQGRRDAAEESIRRALSLRPDYAQAHDSLGTVLWESGRLEAALASTRRALALAPGLARALDNLGGMLKDLGELDEAERTYRRMLEFSPRNAAALSGLAGVLAAKGDSAMALQTVLRSLRARPTARARWIFVDLAKTMRWSTDNDELRGVMLRALSEPWERPCDLAHSAASLIRQGAKTGVLVGRAAQAWPRTLTAAELYGEDGLQALAKDALLLALLTSANAADMELERFLTMARRALLEAGDKDGTLEAGAAFHAALAQQCFLNDYVYFHEAEEFARAQTLRDDLAAALKKGAAISAGSLLAVAAYFPLHAIAGAEKLLERSWPEAVNAVLTQQVREPLAEARLRAALPALTPIREGISRAVQDQYEENPYPRWVRIPRAETANPVRRYLAQKFPFARFARDGGGENILSACCGAGQMMLELAGSLEGKVLAVDLSRTSLGYAARKARELGREDIEFGHADVMELGGIGRRFDVVECSGALHYLADPFAGWRVLLSLLKPKGVMTLSLYSRAARQRIVAARAEIAARGYGATADDIRRCRQELWAADGSRDLRILNTYDFYGISTCRDLLFHVKEWQTDLGEVARFLKENGLAFLGFEIDGATLAAYRRRFPDDAAATDLANWQVFEAENPDTFARMYQFWVQKD